MKLAVMQPYFFPYLGYFQLIAAVDVFVIYDDVNYINKGWINRNWILLNGKPHLIGLALEKRSQNRKINEIRILDSSEKLLKTIEQGYCKAPHFKTVFPLIKCALSYEDRNLARCLTNLLRLFSRELGIETEFVVSSSLKKGAGLTAQDRILSICDEMQATHYINSIGGKALYQSDVFLASEVELSFLQGRKIHYDQYCNPFLPNLSIIDTLMFNDFAQCRALLDEYDLV